MTNYLINLDTDAARLAFQRGQFARFGLAFERVEACRDDPASVARLRWWCATLRPRVSGEVGCVLSHVKVFRTMLERGETAAAVFEDDVVLSPRVVAALELAECACRLNPRLAVLLGDHRRSKAGEPLATADEPLAIEPAVWDFGTEGYVIGAEAARTLLKGQGRVRTSPDAWGYYNHKGWVELARMRPPVAGQAVTKFESQLGVRYAVAGKPFLERAWWKFRRVVGMVIDCLLDGGRRGW